MALEKFDASQILSCDPPLPQRSFQILSHGSTTETANWGGSGTDGKRYGYLTINTSQWAAEEGMNTPPVLVPEDFQIYNCGSSLSSFPAATMMSSTGAPDLFDIGTTVGNSNGIINMNYPVCTVVGTQQVADHQWNVYYSPNITDTITDNKMGIATVPKPRNPKWLGDVGHVAGVSYSYATPGGPDQMQCTLETEPEFRTDAINPGRIMQVYRGGSCVWEGINLEPSPASTGWTLTANGCGTYGDNYTAWYNSWTANNPINHAISRGLRWDNRQGLANPSTLYMGPEQDSGSLTMTDFMNLLCTTGSQYWSLVAPASASQVPCGPWTLRIDDLPNDESGDPLILGVNASNQFVPGEWHRIDTYLTQKRQPPDLYLVSTNPIGRTIAADYNTIVLKYQISGDTTATSTTAAKAATYGVTFVDEPASVAIHGRMEYYLDVSNNGNMTKAATESVGRNILNKYIRANFTQSFTVDPGQLLNSGGEPVDLGCNWGGKVVTVQNINAPAGGEVSMDPITFLIGEYEFDDSSQTATITPYQNALTDMASVVSALYPGKFA